MRPGFFRLPSRWVLTWLTLLIVSIAGNQRASADDEPIKWRTGTELRRHLQSKVTVIWSGSSSNLRSVLSNISSRERVAVLLDRRVDPNRPVDLSMRDVPINTLLQGLVQSLDLGICLVEDVVYIGPKHVASKLSMLAKTRTEELRNLPQVTARRFAAKQGWGWQDLATPRELIQELTESQGIAVHGIEHVPHDLWASKDFPPLSFVKRMSLILAGFDLTFEYARDGSAIKLVRLPDVFVRTFRVGISARSKVAQLARQFPKTKLRADGGNIVAQGPAEDLTEIDQLLKGKRVVRRTTVPGKKQFSLKADNQRVIVLLGAVAGQLGVMIDYDPALEDKLQKRLSIDVKEVSAEKLLKSILDPVGLSFELTKEKLVIK